MNYPITRLRRLRTSESLRALVRETNLQVTNFIYPLFVCEGQNIKKEISSMPGNYQMSVDVLVEECKEVASLGIPSVLLFGIPAYKDAIGSASWQDDGIVQKAIIAIKKQVPNLLIVADVCMCEYTDHGHCGELHDGYVDNDSTLKLLAKQAVSYAKAVEMFYGESRGDVYNFAHSVIDNGADVVFGHGPHVTRAIEVYKERFISYSLGNFCTYGRFNLAGPNGIAPIIKITVDTTGRFISGRIIPCYQPWPGGVQIDGNRRVISRIRELVSVDFPDNAVNVSDNGDITYK